MPPKVDVVETLGRDQGHGAKYKLVEARVDAGRLPADGPGGS